MNFASLPSDGRWSMVEVERMVGFLHVLQHFSVPISPWKDYIASTMAKEMKGSLITFYEMGVPLKDIAARLDENVR